MRILLDEIFPATIARQLREQHGGDVIAVGDDQSLCGSNDEDLFAAAQEAGRTLVTENVRDFRRIAREWQAAGRVHHGVIYTTNRKYPRHRAGTIGRIVRDLARLMDSSPQASVPSNMELWL